MRRTNRRHLTHKTVIVVSMILSIGALEAALAQAPAPATSAKQPCDVEKLKSQWKSSPSQGWLTAAFDGLFSANCSSVRSILLQLNASPAAGGRKLEPNRAFNQAAAEQELKSARAETDYGVQLARELEGETLPARRLLLEAAMLDDRGHYLARDLLVRQISSSSPQ